MRAEALQLQNWPRGRSLVGDTLLHRASELVHRPEAVASCAIRAVSENFEKVLLLKVLPGSRVNENERCKQYRGSLSVLTRVVLVSAGSSHPGKHDAQLRGEDTSHWPAQSKPAAGMLSPTALNTYMVCSRQALQAAEQNLPNK